MFGPHVNRDQAGGAGRPSMTAHIRAARAAAAAAGFNARAFQVFVAGPRNLAMTMRPEEADELREYTQRLAADGDPVAVVAHGTYMDYPWAGKAYPAKFVRTELEMCIRAGISGLVVHLGRPPVEEVLAFIPRLISPARGALIYLEIPHVLPANSHYETPEKLAELFRGIRRLDPRLDRFGLCIDTAHLWSCGVDLSSYDAAADWLRRLDAADIPPARIIVHLNDSLDERGKGLDHHARLLCGKMWGDYRDQPRLSGLAAFVDYIERHGIPAILERDGGDKTLDDYAALLRITGAPRLG